LILFSCSDDIEKTELPPAIEKAETTDKPNVTKADFTKVYIEELDQSQEFFKEQHETSFSHVPNKNWMSFTAGKDGILTKILFFGKANYLISEHYGSGMKGFVRENNPAKGPKLGEWSLSRDEIVNQLAAQGLPETQDGWITIRMRGEIPQESGKTYFLICQEISDGRPWFGAFAFSEGNTYPAGRHWLHPEHDLVFRTYVGKPTDPAQNLQNSPAPLSSPDGLATPSIAKSPVTQPPPPQPMLGNGPRIAPTVDYKPAVEVNEKKMVPVSALEEKTDPIDQKPAIKTNQEAIVREQPVENIESKAVSEEGTDKKSEEKESPKSKSLFDRLFKKDAE